MPGADTAAAKALVDAFLTAQPEGGWPDPVRGAELLTCYRIPQLPGVWARTEDQAVAAATRFTGATDDRVALKGYWPGLVHRTIGAPCCST
ncbi:hypothetical protein [Streptomyces sp. NPDC018031]|uniref:hypothetical protein n=1 Tax=Streptomyces sp. NPDC018031 TaxID=3365033 RepID=UPI0037A14D8D